MSAVKTTTKARLTVKMFGQSLPDLPVLVRTNGGWKMGLNLSFEGNAQIKGPENHSLQMRESMIGGALERCAV